MSTLAWVKLSTEFPRNHKTLALLDMKDGHRAGFVYLSSLCYAGEQGTDGFIPRPGLLYAHGRPQDADKLVDVGLWVPTPGGFQIHDWADHQQTNAETAERTRKAKLAAEIRWAKRPRPSE